MITTMHTLIAVRHAKAESAHLHTRDFDRPLAQQGIEDARHAAAELVRWYPKVTAIIASPALRTSMTAELIASAYGWNPDRVRYDERIYEATVSTLQDIVRELDSIDGAVILVGHNPGLLELCFELTSGATTRMSPGAVVIIPRNAAAK